MPEVALAEGCTQVQLSRNDDGSSNAIDLPFRVQFGSKSFSRIWINNNGNVTFDQSMSTYTPHGLASTTRAIVAPFFADVDTRNPSSGVVTGGAVTFDGRPAYCVNWMNVGYYNSQADKRNSFQLIIVDRSNVASGAFDIVFNYASLKWETGDASGGRQGFGGTSAVAGFTNGDGEYFQVPGSLTPGSLVDGGPLALATSSNVGVPGRWQWKMRAGQAPTDYVAMGDSFQSGEGAYSYFNGTDVVTNRCHRSNAAYAVLVSAAGLGQQLKFVACAGARMAQIFEPYNAQDKQGESAQISALGPDTALVTVGIVGNDLEFAETVTNCVKAGVLLWTDSCAEQYDEAVNARLESLRNGELHRKLSEVYAAIRTKAPRAKVVVVTYPQFFRPVSGSRSRVENCAGMRASDQMWVNWGNWGLHLGAVESGRGTGGGAGLSGLLRAGTCVV